VTSTEQKNLSRNYNNELRAQGETFRFWDETATRDTPAADGSSTDSCSHKHETMLPRAESFTADSGTKTRCQQVKKTAETAQNKLLLSARKLAVEGRISRQLTAKNRASADCCSQNAAGGNDSCCCSQQRIIHKQTRLHLWILT